MHITCMSAISETQNLLSWHKREPYRTYWQHSDQLNPWRYYKSWNDFQTEDWYALMSHSWAQQISTTPSLCCFKPIHKPGIPLHTRPGSTLLLLGHPSILDLPVQYVILPIAHHCDMLLDVTAWSYTSICSPVSMRWGRLPLSFMIICSDSQRF